MSQDLGVRVLKGILHLVESRCALQPLEVRTSEGFLSPMLGPM